MKFPCFHFRFSRFQTNHCQLSLTKNGCYDSSSWCSHHPPNFQNILSVKICIRSQKEIWRKNTNCFHIVYVQHSSAIWNEDFFWSILRTPSKVWLKLKVTSSRFWLKSSPKSQHRCQARDLLEYSICEICSYLQLVFLMDKREEKNLDMQTFYPENQWNSAIWNLRLIATHSGIYGMGAPNWSSVMALSLNPMRYSSMNTQGNSCRRLVVTSNSNLKVTSSRFWLKSSPKSQHMCQARDLLEYSICEICSYLQLVFFD